MRVVLWRRSLNLSVGNLSLHRQQDKGSAPSLSRHRTCDAKDIPEGCGITGIWQCVKYEHLMVALRTSRIVVLAVTNKMMVASILEGVSHSHRVDVSTGC